MKLKPFFCFYGGKWRSAPRYPAPAHASIVEPFAGAAGYATRHHERSVTLVERDPQIAALWRFLVAVSPSEVMAIPDLRDDQTIDELPVCAEARSLVGFWLNKGGSTPKRSPSKWMRDRIRPNSFWGSAIRTRIASQVEQIRHWQIREHDYAMMPDASVTWFIDPPYSGPAGRRYRHHEIDFTGLANWCRGRSGQVIVCENTGADWLPFHPFMLAKSNESRTGGAVSAEAIWLQTNGVEVDLWPHRSILRRA